MLAASAPVEAQRTPARPAAPAPAAAAPAALPDQLTVAKLVWSTMAAVDHANRTGNYSVLRELGSPGFRSANTPAGLAAIFAAVRQQRLDLSNTLLVEPILDFPPRFESGLLRVRGAFRMRPSGVQFDLLFEANGGSWALFGIAVAPLAMPR